MDQGDTKEPKMDQDAGSPLQPCYERALKDDMWGVIEEALACRFLLDYALGQADKHRITRGDPQELVSEALELATRHPSNLRNKCKSLEDFRSYICTCIVNHIIDIKLKACREHKHNKTIAQATGNGNSSATANGYYRGREPDDEQNDDLPRTVNELKESLASQAGTKLQDCVNALFEILPFVNDVKRGRGRPNRAMIIILMVQNVVVSINELLSVLPEADHHDSLDEG